MYDVEERIGPKRDRNTQLGREHDFPRESRKSGINSWTFTRLISCGTINVPVFEQASRQARSVNFADGEMKMMRAAEHS